jgi:hypothetical protein
VTGRCRSAGRGSTRPRRRRSAAVPLLVAAALCGAVAAGSLGAHAAGGGLRSERLTVVELDTSVPVPPDG